MYWLVDVVVILFVVLMVYRGIKKGFMNTFFTLVTAILWIALAAGVSFALMYFVYRPLGWMNELAVVFSGVGEAIASVASLVSSELPATFADDAAKYFTYGLLGVLQFIPLYIFFLWVGRKWEHFVEWVREKVAFLKVFGSVLGGLVNLALAAVIVCGFFWLVGALDGSGLFSYTNEVLRAAPLSHYIYEYNPLYQLGLGGPGSLVDVVKPIIDGNFG